MMRCEICEAPLKVHSECIRKGCEKKGNQSFFPNPLAYLDDVHVQIILAFIANNGNLGETASFLGRQKTWLKQELAVIKEKLDGILREVSILKEFL